MFFGFLFYQFHLSFSILYGIVGLFSITLFFEGVGAGGHGGGAGPPCRVLGPGGGGGEEGGARLVGPRQVLGEGEEGTSPPHDSCHPGNDLGGKGGGVGFITSDEDWFHRFVEPLYSYP